VTGANGDGELVGLWPARAAQVTTAHKSPA
jgi:hypothetical protein